LSAAQRKFWDSPRKTTQTDCILFCRAAKIGNLATEEATQINCNCSGALKILGICQQKTTQID
jgi:hypothetical protein